MPNMLYFPDYWLVRPVSSEPHCSPPLDTSDSDVEMAPPLQSSTKLKVIGEDRQVNDFTLPGQVRATTLDDGSLEEGHVRRPSTPPNRVPATLAAGEWLMPRRAVCKIIDHLLFPQVLPLPVVLVALRRTTTDRRRTKLFSLISQTFSKTKSSITTPSPTSSTTYTAYPRTISNILKAATRCRSTIAASTATAVSANTRRTNALRTSL